MLERTHGAAGTAALSPSGGKGGGGGRRGVTTRFLTRGAALILRPPRATEILLPPRLARSWSSFANSGEILAFSSMLRLYNHSPSGIAMKQINPNVAPTIAPIVVRLIPKDPSADVQP